MDSLTGVLQWYLFQNGNFLRVAAIVVAARMHCRLLTWFSAVTVVRCDFPIPSAQIVVIIRGVK
jgi:hypothetical protein